MSLNSFENQPVLVKNVQRSIFKLLTTNGSNDYDQTNVKIGLKGPLEFAIQLISH